MDMQAELYVRKDNAVRDTCHYVHCHNVWFLHILKHLLVCNRGIGEVRQCDCPWCAASIRRAARDGIKFTEPFGWDKHAGWCMMYDLWNDVVVAKDVGYHLETLLSTTLRIGYRVIEVL